MTSAGHPWRRASQLPAMLYMRFVPILRCREAGLVGYLIELVARPKVFHFVIWKKDLLDLQNLLVPHLLLVFHVFEVDVMLASR